MTATSVYMLLFRIVHSMAGVAWAGSVFLFVTFVQPSSAAIAPVGRRSWGNSSAGAG